MSLYGFPFVKLFKSFPKIGYETLFTLYSLHQHSNKDNDGFLLYCQEKYNNIKNNSLCLSEDINLNKDNNAYTFFDKNKNEKVNEAELIELAQKMFPITNGIFYEIEDVFISLNKCFESTIKQ